MLYNVHCVSRMSKFRHYNPAYIIDCKQCKMYCLVGEELVLKPECPIPMLDFRKWLDISESQFLNL